MRPRAFAATLELRQAGDDKPTKIAGHAAVFDSLSLDMGGWRERIAPGAFARALRDGADVVALFAHDDREVLGRRSAGTLDVREDQTGLAFEIDPPDLEHARKVVTLIRRGDLTGASFAFATRKDTWGRLEGAWVRTLLDVDLFDVSPVTFPAYPSTDVSLRDAFSGAGRERYAALRDAEMRLAQAGLAAAIAAEAGDPDQVARFEHARRMRQTRLAEISLTL